MKSNGIFSGVWLLLLLLLFELYTQIENKNKNIHSICNK